MPSRAKSECARPGCRNLTSRRLCDACWGAQAARRRGAEPWRNYGGNWPAIRAAVLADQPWCEDCADGTLATEVDHVIPERAGGTHARENLRALCKTHHSRKTAREVGFTS